MNRNERSLLIAIALFGIAAITPLTSFGREAAPTLVRSEMPDWPQWRGPRRDGISEETGLLKILRTRWLGSLVFARQSPRYRIAFS